MLQLLASFACATHPLHQRFPSTNHVHLFRAVCAEACCLLYVAGRMDRKPHSHTLSTMFPILSSDLYVDEVTWALCVGVAALDLPHAALDGAVRASSHNTSLSVGQRLPLEHSRWRRSSSLLCWLTCLRTALVFPCIWPPTTPYASVNAYHCSRPVMAGICSAFSGASLLRHRDAVCARVSCRGVSWCVVVCRGVCVFCLLLFLLFSSSSAT